MIRKITVSAKSGFKRIITNYLRKSMELKKARTLLNKPKKERVKLRKGRRLVLLLVRDQVK
jgi:hypothetical protein